MAAEGATLTAMLALVPRELEAAFWHSDTYQSITSVIDFVSVSCGFLITAGYLRWNAKFTGKGGTCRLVFGIAFMFLWAGQAIWMRVSKDSYLRYRPAVVFVQRGIRLLHFFSIPYYGHLTIATLSAPTDPAVAFAFRTAISTPLTHPLLATAQITAMASSSMAALIPAILVPLPFLHQLLLQAAYLAALLTLCLAPSLHCLTGILPPNGPRQICTALNRCIQVTLSLFLGSTPSFTHLDKFCATPHTNALLIVFVDVYVAFVLPAYFAYRLEHYMKLLYLLREHGQHHWPPVPLLVDILLLLSLALLAWVLALLWHEPLARHWGMPQPH